MPRGPIPKLRNMLHQLAKFEPQVLGILLTATVIITIMRLGIFGSVLTAKNKLQKGLDKCTKRPFVDHVCLGIGALISCVNLHIRIFFGNNHESLKEFSLDNRSLLEITVYLLFIGSFAWINTRMILAYAFHLMKIMELKIRYNPTHSAIWALLGFTMGHLGNFLWFSVVKLASSMSPNYKKSSEKYATGTDFIGSFAPVMLTGILILSTNLMKYVEK